jgi:hypothetical protein
LIAASNGTGCIAPVLQGVFISLRRRKTSRHASGIDRSASLATGKGSRVMSVLGIGASGAYARAWGCSFAFGGSPPPGLDIVSYGLPTVINMDVLDRGFLRSLAAMAIE